MAGRRHCLLMMFVLAPDDDDDINDNGNKFTSPNNQGQKIVSGQVPGLAALVGCCSFVCGGAAINCSS